MQPAISRNIEKIYAAKLTAARGARYFFHVKNGSVYLDETGSVFPTDQEAVAQAMVLASELAQDEDWDDFVIVVTVANGQIVAQIPVRK
jgi:hypothetical protein